MSVGGTRAVMAERERMVHPRNAELTKSATTWWRKGFEGAKRGRYKG